MAEAAEADGTANLGSYITSSLRDPQKNAGVGGVEGSNHLTGNAFDINMMNPGPGDEWIRANGSKFGLYIIHILQIQHTLILILQSIKNLLRLNLVILHHLNNLILLGEETYFKDSIAIFKLVAVSLVNHKHKL